MRIIPQCFYDKSIIKIINNLINDGYKSFNDLDEIDKDRLTSICINILGNDAYPCIIESDNFNNTIKHFSNFIKTSNMDEGYELLNVMRKNAIEYFSDILNSLFEENLEDMEFNKKYGNDNYKISWRISA